MDMKSIHRLTRTTYQVYRQAMPLYTPVDHYGQGVRYLIFAVTKILNTFTSIIPCLALRGVATAIARSRSRCIKVLLRRFPSHFVHLVKRSKFVVNSQNDRETDNYTAVDYIRYLDLMSLGSST
jgi:hypothetical protein